MRKTINSNIHKKLMIVFVLLITGISAFLFFFFNSYSVSLLQEKKTQSKNLSEIGIRIITYFYQLADSGSLSHSDAQNLAMSTLQSGTYEDTGYFWINSGEGILLMQPYTPDRVGVNQIGWTDINGQFIFSDFIKKAKSGGGWVTYYWPKPNSEKEYPKISYVSYFEPWNWVLGTGVYLDDVQHNIRNTIIRGAGILITAFIGFVVFSIFIVNYFVRKLEEQSIRDPLTNLYTKRFFNEILPSIISKNQRTGNELLSVIFIDIDYFKKVNDEYGHKCGDMVLTEVAQVLIENVRPNDFCIRFGGEEFIIVGHYINKKAILECAERIRHMLSQKTFRYKEIEFHVTLSAGIAVYYSDKEPFENTIKRADEKLYHSKNTGRNRVSI
ncbi:MAG: diguanylate cyclase [Spirochaetales bacterium]|nr:diguanylate cyclase [Spirochaetales bacterium]